MKIFLWNFIWIVYELYTYLYIFNFHWFPQEKNLSIDPRVGHVKASRRFVIPSWRRVVPRCIDKSIHRLAATLCALLSLARRLSTRFSSASLYASQLNLAALAYAMLSAAFMQTHSIRFPFKANSPRARQRKVAMGMACRERDICYEFLKPPPSPPLFPHFSHSWLKWEIKCL